MQLVIAEKPSVGAALAKALGACEKKKGFIEGDNLISPMKLYVNT
jgi:DNA topoisomerase-3